MKAYIIDDDNVSIYLTRHIIKTAKFPGEVVSYTLAEEALMAFLKEMATQVPELIFLDLNMPAMNGWDFLEALEPYKYILLNRCHIYILTSSLALPDKTKSKQYNLVKGFIHKPIEPTDVEMILSQLPEQVGVNKS